jgi:hypothetical protein
MVLHLLILFEAGMDKKNYLMVNKQHLPLSFFTYD